MITRRQALIGVGCLAIAAGALPLTLGHAAPPAPPPEGRRALRLHLADGFRRQTWTSRDRSWDDWADTILLHPGETIDLTLVNDTQNLVELTPAGPFVGAALRPGETTSVRLHVVDPKPFELQAISHGEGLTKACARVLRRFDVRAV